MLSDALIKQKANEYEVDPHLVKAVIAVETPYPHRGDVEAGMPLILNERHIFYKTTGSVPVSITHPHLSNRNAGGYCTGPNWIARQRCEHARLEEKLTIYNGMLEGPALESISMGLFQVMGFNHTLLGYTDVFAMWDDALKVDDTIDLEWFFKYCESRNITRHLRLGNIVPFVKAYNGQYYYRHDYDKEMIIAWNESKRKGLILDEIPPKEEFPVRGISYKCTANV